MSSSSGERPGYLFVLPWDLHHVGGVNQVVVNLWRELERGGSMEPLLMVIDWAFPRPTMASIDGRKTIRYRLRDPGRDSGAKAGLMYLATLPIALLRMRRLLKAHKIFVVNFHSVGGHALLFVLLRRLGMFQGKIVLSFHGADVRQAVAAGGFDHALLRFLFRSADVRIAVSTDLGNQLSPLVDRESVAVVHNGFDLANLLANRDVDFRLDPRLMGKPFILCVAAFVPWKGQEVLIQAFAGVAGEFPDLLLVLVGGSGPSTEAIRKAVAVSGLGDRILIFQDVAHRHMSNFYEAASLFVLPSREEPFGIVVLEAGAFGLPVIASKVGGIPELISDQETGLLVEPGNVAALQDALFKLLRAPEYARQLGAALLLRTSRDFNWRRTYEGYMRKIGGSGA